MLYLDENNLHAIGSNWGEYVRAIQQACYCLKNKDFCQPIKPYLRYRDLTNRIIAMPAFVGDTINTSGIKWIASFPENRKIGLPRAHSVVILNCAETGKPECIINTPFLSIVRTSSVSGLVLKNYLNSRNNKQLTLGITGIGPIGQYHIKLIDELFPKTFNKINVYDINDIKLSEKTFKQSTLDKVSYVSSWEQAYDDADVFLTCTVSKEPYINKKPKAGSLHLNVSLRDYCVNMYNYFKDSVIVDSWEEVCRENTDIENMHKKMHLNRENTIPIFDVVDNSFFHDLDENTPIFFNPMGMAVFDIAIGSYFFSKAQELKIGTFLS